MPTWMFSVPGDKDKGLGSCQWVLLPGSLFKLHLFVYVVHEGVCMHAVVHASSQGTAARVDSSLPSRGFQKLNSDPQHPWHVPLPSEPSCWP